MKVGFVGLGTMGAPMAHNVLKAGFDVTVHNRTRKKEEPLVAAGAKRAATPAAAAGEADIVVTIVSDTPYFEAVAEGLVFAMKAGLDTGKVLEAISAGMARSAVLEMRASNILNDTHPLGFKLSLHLKDLGIALATAKRNGVELPLAEMVKD